MEKKNAYVYILEMRNGRYYIGSTTNIERRVVEHNEGRTKSTKNNRPVKLLYYREFDTYKKANQIELSLKKQKSRSAVEKFMNGF